MNSISGTITGSSVVIGKAGLQISIRGSTGVGTKAIHELQFLPFSEFPEVGTERVLYIDTTNDSVYYWADYMYHSLSGLSDNKIFIATTDEWNSSFQQSIYGGIYIYSDYRQENNVYIPAIKIGDGNSYVVDLPFFDTGVTETDRDFWNNKVSVRMSTIDPEMLILYTD